MEERKWKITLADGTELEGLGLNGNNFISVDPLTEEDFDGKLEQVVITDGETVEEHENMELVQIQRHGVEYWFILREITSEEMAALKLRSDIDYLAAMADIDLEG